MIHYQLRLAVDGGFPINHALAGVVPMALDYEQVALLKDIQEVGQNEPITLWRGQVVDGRCRQHALTLLKKDIMYKELDDELTEDEVRIWVKSVNTRRNLTQSQKIAVACKDYDRNKARTTLPKAAEAWGISSTILSNALWLLKNYPAVIGSLFDGGTVPILNKHGQPVQSTKVTAIYAHYRKASEQTVQSVVHGWSSDSYIKTQAGKEWYYEQLGHVKDATPYVRQLIAELANYKFVCAN